MRFFNPQAIFLSGGLARWQTFLSFPFGIVFLLSNLVSLSFWIYLWQLKEYRRDRFRAYLETRQGKRALINIFFFGKVFFIVDLVFLSFNVRIGFLDGLWRISIYWLIYGGELLLGFLNLWRRRFKKPKITARSLLIMVTVLLGQLGLVFLESTFEVLLLLTLSNLLLPFLVFLAIRVWFPLTWVAKRLVISRARRKLKKHPNLKIIGITGSFGKTSTKEFT
ncbi:hypothetical protein ACFLZP_04990, partial [Patescibacteria group bacterium]